MVLVAHKYLITYRLNEVASRRLNIWVENPLTGFHDVEELEAYLNDHHTNMNDRLGAEGCKILAFSKYDVSPTIDPFSDSDQSLYFPENDDLQDRLNALGDAPAKPTKPRPNLVLIKSTHPPEDK